jgi:hypothetical protein
MRNVRQWLTVGAVLIGGLIGGYCVVRVGEEGRDIEVGKRYHRGIINSYVRYMSDPDSLRHSATFWGISPEEVRDWYTKQIDYHSKMLERLDRARPIDALFDSRNSDSLSTPPP